LLQCTSFVFNAKEEALAVILPTEGW